MSLPAVTILICTHNRQKQLLRCLESIFKLKYPSFDLVLVDNGSTNFSVPNLEYSSRTRIYSHPVPGLSRARNSVLDDIDGQIIALMDDDAIADENWLNAAIPHFNDPEVGCVTGKIVPMEVKNEWQERQIEKGMVSASDVPQNFDETNFDPLTSSPGTGSNILIRTELIKQIRFPERFGPGTPVFAGDEHYLFHRIINAHSKIHYEPTAIVYHEYVESEKEFENRMFRMMVSRGALLTTFALLEKGFKAHTIKHLISKVFSKPNQAGMVIPRKSKIKGLFRGPFALLASAWKQKRSETTLVAEFNGSQVRSATIDV